jgi:thiamine-monophosphate kinase
MYRTKEQRLIAMIRDWTQERLIGDDCAVLPGGQLISMDTLVEGTHFLLPGIGWEDLGWKSLAVNLSDLAAMAGKPGYALVSLTLPQQVDERAVEKLYAGLLDCARTYRCRVVGGDLTAGPLVSVSIAVLGSTHESGTLLRAGAKSGDVIAVTGDFGASAAYLKLNAAGLGGAHWEFMQDLKQRHFRPLPRLAESWSFAQCSQGRGALMDASDGLADALVQICAASKVGMSVGPERIPIAESTRKAAAALGKNAVDWALYGGEDYELVGTLAPESFQLLTSVCPGAFHQIGEVVEGEQAFLVQAGGGKQHISLEHTYQHWR